MSLTNQKRVTVPANLTMPNLYKFLLDGMTHQDFIFVYNAATDLFDITTEQACTCRTIHGEIETDLFRYYYDLYMDYKQGFNQIGLDPIKRVEEEAGKFGLAVEHFLEVLKNSLDYYEEYFPEKFI